MGLEWRQVGMREAMQMGPEAFMIPMDPVPQEEYDFNDRLMAHLRLENSVASAYTKNVTYGSEEPDVEGFNPFVDLEDRFWNFNEMISRARSPDQLRQTKAFIDAHIRDRQIQAESGGIESFMMTMGSSLIDPITWPAMAVPIGHVYRGAKSTGIAGRTAGLVTADVAMQEAALHATQPLRTWEETLMAMGGAGVLGYGMGAWAGRAAKQRALQIEATNRVEADVIDMLENGGLREVPDMDDAAAQDLFAARSVGAAEVADETLIASGVKPTLEGEGISGFLGKGGKWIAPWSPMVRMLSSPVAEVRALTNRLFSHNFVLGKNIDGRKSELGADTRVKNMAQSMEAGFMARGNELYSKMLGRDYLTTARMLARFQGGMKYNEFMEETGKAMTRGDKHEIPEVAAFARHIRSTMLDPVTKAFQDLGDLPQYLQVDFAESYLPRVYRKDYIRDNRVEWDAMLDEHLRGKGVGSDYRPDIIRRITDQILDSPNGRIYGDIASTVNGRLKDRSLDIEDNILQEAGFLETNVSVVTDHYLRSVLPELVHKQLSGYKGKRGLVADIRTEARTTVAERSKGIRQQTNARRDAEVAELYKLRPNQLKAARVAQITEEWGRKLDDYKAKEQVELARKIEGKSEKMVAHLTRLSETRVAKREAQIAASRDKAVSKVTTETIEQSIRRRSKAIAREYRAMTRAEVKEVKDAQFTRMKEDIEIIEATADSQLMWKEQLDEIRDIYEEQISAAKTNKEKIKLQKQRDADMRDLQESINLSLGISQPLGNVGKRVTNASQTVRGLMFMTHLGGMTISAIPDMARPIIQNGFAAYMRALPASFRYFSKQMKGQRKVLQEMGVGVEGMTSSRVYALGGLDDYANNAMWRWNRTFAQYAGMNQWNSFWKQTSGFIAQDRLLRDAMNYDKLGKHRKTRLAKAGIDEDTARIIASEKEHFEQLPGGGWVANTKKWSDQTVADQFDHIILRDVEVTINTPGIGDRPLLMQKETAKHLLQFKSFFMAAHNQTFLPLLQRAGMGDWSAINGVAMTMPLAALTYIIRMHLSGRSDELDDTNTQQWALEIADRSGLIPMMIEAFNMSNMLSNGRVGSTMGLTQSSRYYFRNKAGSFAGPAFGYTNDLFDVSGALLDDKEFAASDLHKARRLLPYQNLFYARWLFDALEEQVAEFADLPDRRKK